MCYEKSSMPRCCKLTDFSKAKKLPGDEYVSVGNTKVEIHFYEVDFFSKRIIFFIIV